MNQWLGPITDSYDAAEHLARIETPVFLSLREHDFAGFYIHQWQTHKDKLPNLTCAIFEKSAHYPMLEEEDLFDRTLIDWAKAQQK